MIYTIIFINTIYIILELFLLKEKVYKPSILFATVWCLILLFYKINSFGLPKVSNLIYIIIFCGLLSFFVGSLIIKLTKVKVKIGDRTFFQNKINYNLVNKMNIIFLISLIIPFFHALIYILHGFSLYDIRYTLQNDILGNGAVAILFNYFCEPYLTFLIVFSVTNLFSNHKKKKVIITTVIGIFSVSIITGGRFFILYLVASLLVASIIFHKKTEKKTLKKAKLIICFSFCLLIVVSMLRGSKVFETINVYFCGGLPFLDHLIQQNISGYTYGGATLYGFLRPLLVIIRKVLNIPFPIWFKNIEKVFLAVDNPYYLTSDILFNSFTTAFYAPFLDYGLIGIIFVFFILGLYSEYIYRQIDLNNEYIISCFLLVSLIIMLSFFRLTITHYSFSLSFIYLFLVHSRWGRKSIKIKK